MVGNEADGQLVRGDEISGTYFKGKWSEHEMLEDWMLNAYE